MKQEEIKKLTLSGILTGVTIIVFAIGLFVPFFNIIIILGVPFSACLVNLKTDVKYSLIYVLSTTIIASLINFQDALFYMIPGLITGLLFGIFIKRKTHCLIFLILTSIISIILQILSIELINAIYDINFLETFAIFLRIDLSIVESIQYLLFFLIGLIQNILVFFLLEKELPKFDFNTKDDYSLFYPLLIITVIASSLGMILNKLVPPISYLLTGISLFTLANLIFYYIKSNSKWMSFVFVSIVVIDFFLFITLNTYLQNQGYYLFFNIITLSICLIGVILILDIVLVKKTKLDNDFFIKNKSLLDQEEDNHG